MVNPVTRRPKGKRRVKVRTILVGMIVPAIALTYFSLVFQFYDDHSTASSDQGIPAKSILLQEQETNDLDFHLLGLKEFRANMTATTKATFKEWKKLAVELAALPPASVLQILKTDDPFGVRKFEQSLQDLESKKQAILSQADIETLFPCPTTERITLPDRRDHGRAQIYRDYLFKIHPAKKNFIFLFFQHLRKAGGTNFCGLAKNNLLKQQVPS